MNSLMIRFGRNSFDRFGDDLIEEILRYLPLSDCFGLQCVNKQFKQFIFNKQTKLRISDGSYTSDGSYSYSVINNLIDKKKSCAINVELLNYVMNKSVNISHISYSIIFNSSYSSEERIKFIIPLQTFSEKLKRIHINNCDIIFNEFFRQNNQRFMNNIETVFGYRINDESFITFADYFKHRLKCLYVEIEFDVRINILKQLECFNRLEYLYCFCNVGQDFCEVLKQIGLKCKNLKILVIDWLETPFYEIFNNGFKSLKKLSFKKSFNKLENLALLKGLVNLTHFYIFCVAINENYFEDIHLFLPQLKSIETYGYSYESKGMQCRRLLQNLSRLPNLNDLKFGSDIDCWIRNDYVITFISICLSIRRISIYHVFVDLNEIQQYIRNNNRKIDVKNLLNIPIY